MPYTTRGSQKYSVSSAPGEGGAAEASGDHANDPLAIGGPFDDGDTGSDAEAMPTETPEEHLSDSRMAAMSAAIAEALTSKLAQMQAAQDQRTAAMTEQLALLTAALTRGTPPASTPEQLQGSRGGVSAGDTAVAPSTRGHPPHHHVGSVGEIWVKNKYNRSAMLKKSARDGEVRLARRARRASWRHAGSLCVLVAFTWRHFGLIGSNSCFKTYKGRRGTHAAEHLSSATKG